MEEQLKSLIQVNLSDAIDGVFEQAHQFAGTKSGDITPEQKIELDSLQARMKEIIFNQTMQNIPKSETF